MDISKNTETAVWNAKLRVKGVYYDPLDLPLQVDQKTIDDLLIISGLIKYCQDQPVWEKVLQLVSKGLKKVFFDENPGFSNKFYTYLGDVNHEFKKIGIRFTLERGTHPLILEALGEEEGEDGWDYWMVKAPIYRAFRTGLRSIVYAPPLFPEQGSSDKLDRINCLVIKSDIGCKDGHVLRKKIKFDDLANIHEEAHFIEQLSQKYKDLNVQIIPREPDGKCTAGLVKDWLTTKGPWHIVHYVGHSVFEEEKRKGYLILHDGRRAVPLENGEFGVWLRAADTRFIYLSSCCSSDEDSLYELVSAGIPSALGFRWKIEDHLAAEHTEEFYAHLFDCRSLKYAFLNTREKMQHDHPDNIIWAAPVLVLQVE